MSDDKHDEQDNPDIHFEPIVQLPPVIETTSLEADEDVLIKLRAKLFRFDNESEPTEWKDRGTGDVKILKHKRENRSRVLMRRDKTHKICANHFLNPAMELKPNCGSEKAWVWSVAADFADEEAKPELLAIRFGNAENAQKFKAKFDEAKQFCSSPSKDSAESPSQNGDASDKKDTSTQESPTKTETKTEESKSADDVTKKLEELTVKEGDKTELSNGTKPENTDS
ncbi:unnamed protein product [Owenia fusiformis]|uniref:Uncharacterized protein n=1 Tax=Owenia fusiformis TaxID=6347 RepID=A0A8J1TLJ7_OWEFU|nr:unnamed protein product [Owenia fusiformis]